MPFNYIIGAIIILYGIRFALKGPGLRSKPRMMVGIAMVLVGVAQFFQNSKVGVGLSIAGVMLFVVSIILMRGQIRRGRRPGR